MRWFAGCAGLAVVLALFVACGSSEPYAFASIVYEPARTPPPLRLTDQHGQRFDLADLDGQVVAIFFGYTHCPDVCPLTMGQLAAVKESLPSDRRGDFRVVMVTTDPERDTPDVLAEYLARFGPGFVGLTGSHDQVVAALTAWGIRAEVEQPFVGGVAPAEYTMLHASSVLVVDRHGMTRLKMLAQMANADRAADIAALIEEG